MRFSPIPPATHLDLVDDRDFHLILVHICETDPGYAAYFLNHLCTNGSYVILDNSAFELGKSVDTDVLVKWAKLMRPSEIVLPDLFYDIEGTLRASLQTIEALKPLELERTKLAACPQGADFVEWCRCLDKMVKIPEIQVISVNLLALKWFPSQGRSIPLKYIQKEGYHKRFEVHLLGGDRALAEPSEIPRAFPWVRSTDSVKPISLAYHGVALVKGAAGLVGQEHLYRGRPHNYFYLHLSPEQLVLARNNISVYDAWIKEGVGSCAV